MVFTWDRILFNVRIMLCNELAKEERRYMRIVQEEEEQRIKRQNIAYNNKAFLIPTEK